MGAWSVEIFGDDAAVEARLHFHNYLRDGLSVTKATDATLVHLADWLRASDDGPVVILGLAAAQWNAGRVDRRIKSRALKIIRAGVDERWLDGKSHEARRAVLAALAARLNSPAPARVPLDDLDESEAEMS